jgi:hypothetical protein
MNLGDNFYKNATEAYGAVNGELEEARKFKAGIALMEKAEEMRAKWRKIAADELNEKQVGSF